MFIIETTEKENKNDGKAFSPHRRVPNGFHEPVLQELFY